jgi:hypothetical protein
MDVATEITVSNNIQSCTIDTPPNFGIGNWNLTVIANGIPSDDVAIKIVSGLLIFYYIKSYLLRLK